MSEGSRLLRFWLFIAAALTFGGDFQRRDGNGFAVFDRDHGEVAAVGMAHFAGADVLRLDADADFHRGSACVVDAGVEGYQVADVYRFFKQNFIDRQGNAVVAAVTAGAGISNLVEQAQSSPPWTLPLKLAVSGIISSDMMSSCEGSWRVWSMVFLF